MDTEKQRPITEIIAPGLIDRLCETLEVIVDGGQPFGPFPLARSGQPKEGEGASLGAEGKHGAAEGGSSFVGRPTLVPVEPQRPPRSAWPSCAVPGSKVVEPEDVERLAVALLADESITGEGEAVGLTVKRLKTVMESLSFDGAMIGRTAPAIVLWLAQAGVLAEPASEATPWAAPRKLTATAQEALRDALKAAPPLTADGIAEARRRGLK